MMILLNPPGTRSTASVAPQEAPLAPASADLVAAIKASAETSVPVQETLKSIAQTGVPPAQALYEEGLLRLDDERWREAAQLMAATVARDPKHPHASSGDGAGGLRAGPRGVTGIGRCRTGAGRTAVR